MKLWGQISIEIDVKDYIEAADQQRRLEQILSGVRDTYPGAKLTMRERRQRKPQPAVPALPRSDRASVLSRYET